MTRAVVTGGTGFIGSSLCSYLSDNCDYEVIGVGSNEVDLCSPEDTKRFFSSIGEVDHIFHLAALYKAGGWPLEHPATQFNANLLINVNLLESWAKQQPKAKLTSVLSYCMYPPHDEPHPESELWGTEPEEYLFSYAMTKKALLVGHRAYQQEYGLRCTSVVLPTVYGSNDSFAEDSHVMGALIGKFVRAAKNELGEVEVWGDGTQEREFLHIDDAVKGIVEVANRSTELVLNMGCGGSESIKSISGIIAEAAGFKGKTRFISEDRFVGVLKRELESSRIHEILGWQAEVSLVEGIGRTVNWYKENC
jgi:GDP-L-fucose synthase